MARFQKFRKPYFLKWVSTYFVENQLKSPFWQMGSFHIAQGQNPRLYRSKRLAVSENSDKTMLAEDENVARIPRATLKEAQAALLEYLHSTRSIQFMEAENMSKNSPYFLQKLLKKVDKEKDVRSSMSRFLRYHPINEFEPFLESLGLKPCEYTPLLPRDLIFLSDDCLLLENCRVLSEYGIKRDKIGEIYKKAGQVFQHEVGVLPLKLQAYTELGLSQSFMIKMIVSSPRLLLGDINMKFIKVLEILRSVGFDYAWIEEHLSEEDSYNWSMILRVLNYFRVMDCCSELHGLIIHHPGLFFGASGDRALSLIAFLLKFGYPMDQISSLFLHFPDIQIGQFVSNFIKCFLLFLEIGMELDEIGKIVCSYPLLLCSITLKKTNSLLNILNVGKRRLCKFIQENPQELSKWVKGTRLAPLPDSGEDIESKSLRMKFLLDLGYGENPDMMKRALKTFRGKGGELQERFDSIVNAGLDKKDVAQMVKVSPQILNQSKDVIQAKINILVNELGYPISTLVEFPSYLSYTTQRVKLRLTMYYWLKDQGIADPNLALSTLVGCSEEIFLRRYVKDYPCGLQIWKQLKCKFYPG